MSQGKAVLAAVVILAAGACASTGQRPGEAARDESLITAAELQSIPPMNLSDFIQRYRPRWLQRNYASVFHAGRMQGVVVFMDNQEFGGPDALRTVSTTSVREVRYYSPSEAEGRFGPGYINGVIQLVSASGR